MKSDLLQFFAYEHLPAHLQEVSKMFAMMATLVHEHADVARDEFDSLVSWLGKDLPTNTESREAVVKLQHARARIENQFVLRQLELGDWSPFWRDVVLRLVLEAKDCAVRARLYKPVTE